MERLEITNWLLCGGMTLDSENPNLKRRTGPGFWIQLAGPLVKPFLLFFRQSSSNVPAPLTVFQSYLVGDLYMALPALKRLDDEFQIRVLCRPDCVEILKSEGLVGLPFENEFFVRPGLKSFVHTFVAVWKLRGQVGSVALDFDADPRTAFWLKIAGARQVFSYSRHFASFFDHLFPIPNHTVHQADKNDAVVAAFLARWKNLRERFEISRSEKPNPLQALHSPSLTPGVWLISCWTRKDTKNWPLEKWEEFLERLIKANISFKILEAPDGDVVYQTFKQRWSQRVNFVSGTLIQVAHEVQNSAGVIATDNFTGHMAGFYGKPVLWINGSSDPRQVLPRGLYTDCVQVEPMPCRPCGHRCINPDYKACLKQLNVDDVWKAFEKKRTGGE